MKQVTGLLKLADNAQESEVYQAVKRLQDENTTLLADKTRLEGEVVQLKETTKADKEAKIKNLLDGAVKDRRILEANRGVYTKLAEKDFESTEAAIKAMPVLSKLSDEIGGAGLADKYKGKTWDDLDKSGALEELKLADIGLFKELYKNKFKKDFAG